MEIDNLLFHCEQPKVIKTKSGQTMAVSCGKCISCLVDKCRCRAGLINAESEMHKFQVFVTLTYKPDCVPTMFYSTDEFGVTHFFDASTNEELGDLKISTNKLISLVNKSSDKRLHYARFSDAQKFLKRLRKHLTKYYNEKIRYYIVSEYGPRTYRPHYHAILFFNSSDVYANLGKVLSKTWPLGHFDYSQSRGGSANYVASYINSYVDLPQVFKLRCTSPRQSHSQRFALPHFSDSFKKTYKYSPSSLVRIVRRSLSQNITSIAPWRSFKTFLFPKCYDFSNKSLYERYETYGVLPHLIKRYNTTKITDIASYIMEDYYLHELPSFIAIALFNRSEESYFLYEPPSIDILLHRLYKASHFYYLMSEFDITAMELSHIVSTFYSSLDYRNLCDQYELMERISDSNMNDKDLFLSAYSYGVQLYDTLNGKDYIDVNGNLLEISLIKKLYQNSMFNDILRQSRLDQYNKALKHKTMNDLYLFNN